MYVHVRHTKAITRWDDTTLIEPISSSNLSLYFSVFVILNFSSDGDGLALWLGNSNLLGKWRVLTHNKKGGGAARHRVRRVSQRSVARSAVFQRNWATFEVLPRVEFLVRGLGRPILHANYMSNIVMFHWWNIDFWYWASFGLVLIGHWEGFVTKTWQPCPSERQLGARHTEVSAVSL